MDKGRAGMSNNVLKVLLGLHSCKEDIQKKSCEHCPYYCDNEKKCKSKLIKDAYTEIKKLIDERDMLTKEIEELKKLLDSEKEYYKELSDKYKRQEVIEVAYPAELKEANTRILQEFAERLLWRINSQYRQRTYIRADRIVKIELEKFMNEKCLN